VIPQFLDVEKLTASHRHGMLRLTLPLKESVKPRRVQIRITTAIGTTYRSNRRVVIAASDPVTSFSGACSMDSRSSYVRSLFSHRRQPSKSRQHDSFE